MAQQGPAAVAPYLPGRDDGRPFQHSHASAEHAALVQSRETGDVLPDDSPRGQVKALPFAKSWVHFMAGGYVCFSVLGSMKDSNVVVPELAA